MLLSVQALICPGASWWVAPRPRVLSHRAGPASRPSGSPVGVMVRARAALRRLVLALVWGLFPGRFAMSFPARPGAVSCQFDAACPRASSSSPEGLTEQRLMVPCVSRADPGGLDRRRLRVGEAPGSSLADTLRSEMLVRLLPSLPSVPLREHWSLERSVISVTSKRRSGQ